LAQKRWRGEEGQTNTFSFLEKKKTCAKKETEKSSGREEKRGKPTLFLFSFKAKKKERKEKAPQNFLFFSNLLI
jgi:hypothetical protein